MTDSQPPSNSLSIEERAIVEQLALSGWGIREHDPGGYCEQNEFWLENRGTTLRVDQVRKLQSKGWLTWFNGGYRLSDEGRALLVAGSTHEPAPDWQQIARERTADVARADAEIERLQRELELLHKGEKPPRWALADEATGEVWLGEYEDTAMYPGLWNPPKRPAPEPLVDRDAALKEFTAYFVRNYPGQNTIISDPTWHAPKIFRAAEHAIKSATSSSGTALAQVNETAEAGHVTQPPPAGRFTKTFDDEANGWIIRDGERWLAVCVDESEADKYIDARASQPPAPERQPIPVTEIVTALEREAANTDTDPRWMAAQCLRHIVGWESRTFMCRIDTRPSAYSTATKRVRCEGCGNEIDPETCGCGDPIKGHSIGSGHSPVPMGCDCHRASQGEEA